MDLRHITGESIFQGDRRALSNLVNILLRIATITGYANYTYTLPCCSRV
jgi:hypothetical protein